MSKRTTYEVIKATQRPMTGLELNGKKMKFSRQNALRIKDRAQAKDIEQKYGEDVTVTPIEVTSEPGHKYRFTAPGMPWHKYDELGRRIDPDKETKPDGAEEPATSEKEPAEQTDA